MAPPALALLFVTAVACGGGGRSGPVAAKQAGGVGTVTTAAPGNTGGGALRTPGAAIQWEDPEPPGAQALAEAVVGERWNADKTTALRMRITTLVDRTTGIEGFATSMASEERSLQRRLDDLGAEVTPTEVTIRLPGAILFDFDSASIRPDAARALAEVAAVVLQYGERPVRVEGHTDAIASEAYNLGLSRQRAAAVAVWLAENGVAQRRLTTQGWGESRPVDDNGTAAGRQRNRRVEVIIEQGQ